MVPNVHISIICTGQVSTGQHIDLWFDVVPVVVQAGLLTCACAERAYDVPSRAVGQLAVSGRLAGAYAWSRAFAGDSTSQRNVQAAGKHCARHRTMPRETNDSTARIASQKPLTLHGPLVHCTFVPK